MSLSDCLQLNRGLRDCLASFVFGTCLTYATAQVPVNPSANVRTGPVQTGRVLDRNPQVGSGGFNYTRPVSPLLGGNLIANGVAGNGMAFQGFSPIGDPTAFRASLGSGFRRGHRTGIDGRGVSGATIP